MDIGDKMRMTFGGESYYNSNALFVQVRSCVSMLWSDCSNEAIVATGSPAGSNRKAIETAIFTALTTLGDKLGGGGSTAPDVADDVEALRVIIYDRCVTESRKFVDPEYIDSDGDHYGTPWSNSSFVKFREATEAAAA